MRQKQLDFTHEPGWFEEPRSEPLAIVRHLPGVEVHLAMSPALEARDVVLSALKHQLSERVIDFHEYNLRRAAYLNTFLPDIA